MYPDIVVIGAMKSGTSTFYKNLVRVPLLNFTTRKECNILVEYSGKKIDEQYRKVFGRSHSPAIDVSPAYSRRHIYDNVAEKLYGTNPDAKIIYLVRDPLERLVSHINHDVFRDRVKGIPDLSEKSDYILTSSYFHQISPFIKLFGKHNILVYPLEKLIKDEYTFQKVLKEFLNIDFTAIKFIPFNISGKRYVIKFHDPVHRIVRSSFILKLYHLFWYVINLKPQKITLSESQKNSVYAILKNDIDRFCAEFSVDTTLWKTCHGIKETI